MSNLLVYGPACNPTIMNCIFTGNSARSRSGAIYGSPSSLTLANCTFEGNRAGGSSFGTAVGSLGEGPVTITNCILWNGPTVTSPLVTGDILLAITYSNMQGGWPGEGNIDTDPRFADPGHWDPNGTPADPNDDVWVNGDYHLLPDSPCIDAGDPNFITDPNKPQTDVYGGPRFTGKRIDMGADEYSE
jgi:hypothetical protein